MQISSHTSFDRDPAATYALLTDEEFLAAVCAAGRALNYQVAVDGATTTTSQELPSPDLAASFVGKTLTVVQTIAWGAAAADGTRRGQVSMTIPKQPVHMSGTFTLSPNGTGTAAVLQGELKVNVPFLGRKLEQASEPAVLAGFCKQEEVARTWGR